jgi:DNA adenine methylase
MPPRATQDMDRARPFMKWAGGKGYLLPELVRHLPHTFRRYHEPFVGAAARCSAI